MTTAYVIDNSKSGHYVPIGDKVQVYEPNHNMPLCYDRYGKPVFIYLTELSDKPCAQQCQQE